MTRIPVNSSNLVSAGYHDTVLEIEFKNGVYRYYQVPQQTWDAFLTANSKGQFFHAHIKGRFDFAKLETV